MKKIFIVLIALASTIMGKAQNNELSSEELDSWKERCQEIIEAFQYGLEIIGDKSQEKAVKQHYKENILEFFMGKGEPYYLKVDGVNKRQEPVSMQVSSLNRKEPRSVQLKNYLNHIENMKYKHVKISKARTCVISNFYPVDGMYIATVTIFQVFEGYGGEMRTYRDKTQKDIKVYLHKVTDGNLGEFWDLKLGDINVVATEKF